MRRDKQRSRKYSQRANVLGRFYFEVLAKEDVDVINIVRSQNFASKYSDPM